MPLPDFLLNLGKESATQQAWVDALPCLIERAKLEWGLKIGKPYLENVTCSYVVPCRYGNGQKAVLKIGMPHEEALHEIEGLDLLSGYPTVKLLDFHKSTNSMLLEACEPGKPLKALPEPIQDEIICSLLPKIWTTPHKGKNFRSLGEMVKLWNGETLQSLAFFPDPELAREGCRVKEELVGTNPKQELLATDLHAGNVLQAERMPWLAIDIKPYLGDRTYDLTQHLLNCLERVSSDPVGTTNRVATLAGLDARRLKRWMFARLASEMDGKYQELAASFL